MPRTPDATLDDVLSVFEQSDDPVLTASEVADYLDVSRRTALRKLQELEEQGEVGRKEVGSRAVVWWEKT
jgi:predicted ArsR family transcriptional regulator